MVEQMKVKVIFPNDPDFKKLMAEGKILSGADVEYAMFAIKAAHFASLKKKRDKAVLSKATSKKSKSIPRR